MYFDPGHNRTSCTISDVFQHNLGVAINNSKYLWVQWSQERKKITDEMNTYHGGELWAQFKLLPGQYQDATELD